MLQQIPVTIMLSFISFKMCFINDGRYQGVIQNSFIKERLTTSRQIRRKQKEKKEVHKSRYS